jgi:hypothetical protein
MMSLIYDALTEISSELHNVNINLMDLTKAINKQNDSKTTSTRKTSTTTKTKKTTQNKK